MARLMINTGMDQDTVWELKPGSNFLGRDEQNDLQFIHPAISTRHCEIILQPDGVFVRDLGSTNGTFIDDQPITEAPLRHGQKLRVGVVEMYLDAPPVHIAIPALPPPPPPALPTFQPDGAPNCLNHADLAADYLCTQCGDHFCEDCITKLRRVGGATLELCPSCSGHCERLTPRPPPRKMKTSLIKALKRTVMLPFKARRSKSK